MACESRFIFHYVPGITMMQVPVIGETREKTA